MKSKKHWTHRVSAVFRAVSKALIWTGSKCQAIGADLENATGAGDIIATGTKATRIDIAAEWFATRVLGLEGCGCPARRNRLNTLYRFDLPKLVIAIPEYNDRAGLWAMVNELYDEIRCARLQDHVEILVVTQTPTIQAPERHILDFGTPQQREEAPIPTTVIAGADQLKGLCDSITARGVKCHYREFTSVIGTSPAKRACWHFAAQLGAEWAWVCDSHLHFAPGSVGRFFDWVSKTKNRNSKHLYHCPLLLDQGTSALTHFETRSGKLALIGGDNLWGQFRTEIGLLRDDSEPMEIQAHGGFWMASRVDIAGATFGHDLFKGFSDPETIIHEQRRAAGFKVFCLPSRIVSCWHRFMKVRHNDYHSPWTHALRNHVIGVQSMRVHFMREAAAAGYDEPVAWIVESWIAAHPDRADQIRQTAMAAVDEFRQWKAEKVKAAEDARQKQEAAKTQTAPAVAIENSDPVIAQYLMAVNTPSDINQHLKRMFELSEGVTSIAEFGVRSGESTRAFLAAKPKRLYSFDTSPNCAVGVQAAPGTRWIKLFDPQRGDSLKADLPEDVDIVFIDTLHTRDQVYAELSRHGKQCKRYLIGHDYHGPFGTSCQAGENKGGVQAGVKAFLAEHPEWKIKETYEHNNGLFVLERA